MNAPQRWFDTLLRVFPLRFRARHGDDMRDSFDAAWAEHRAAGRLRIVRFIVRTSFDLILAGIREHLAPAGRRSGGGSLGGVGDGGLVSWLDVKLGVRMLGKHPGLTLVATFALAVGIPVGLAPSHFVDGMLAPLPVPEGDRIRTLRLWSPALGRTDATTWADFEMWRPSLSSFEDLGAFRLGAHNVDAGEGVGSAVKSAEVTASTFALLRVRPLLGRTIQPSDEVLGAADVAVIGYDLWQARYAGDPAIVGETIRLGSVPHTVVGVMPEGFLFPKRQSVWTPLRVTTPDRPEDAAQVVVFGRLARGVSETSAQAEFATMAGRSTHPGRDPRLQAQVAPFGYILMPGLNGGLRATPEFLAFQVLALLVLLVACANVGMLVFARTATRAGELAVRTALGASRTRIVAQVFVECLVLAVMASGAGLLLAWLLVGLFWRFVPAGWATALPYWIDWGITGGVVLEALALAGVSAVAAGVVPALRFTGKAVQSNIQRAASRRTGVRFGGLTGVLIVADVAVAVSVVGFALTAAGEVKTAGDARDRVGIEAGEYLAATISVPSAEPDGGVGPEERARHAARVAAAQEELVRRLRADPAVRDVAVADYLPRMEHRSRIVEAEGVTPPDGRTGFSTRTARVDLAFFRSLGRPILAGRDFGAGDLGEDRSTVIVNTTFVEKLLGGQNAIGRRIRFRPWGDGEPGPWKEIVGVVGHLGMRVISDDNDQGVYEPMAPGDLSSVTFGIHVGDNPEDFTPRLRELAADVDPEAIVSVIGGLDSVYEGDWYLLLAASLGAMLFVGVLLALAASGIYALMSFAVAERTVELGIRAALGAGRSHLARSVATRAMGQLALGVLLGMPLAGLFFTSEGNSTLAGASRTVVAGVAVLVIVGLAACTGPTLRALRVHPSEALRGQG